MKKDEVLTLGIVGGAVALTALAFQAGPGIGQGIGQGIGSGAEVVLIIGALVGVAVLTGAVVLV